MSLPLNIFDAVRQLLDEQGHSIAEPGGAWHCTELTAYGIGTAAALPAGWLSRRSQWWRDMQIIDPSKPWTSLHAATAAAQHVGVPFGPIVGPVGPTNLPLLEPGLYLAQGWVKRPGPDEAGSGHAFFVEARAHRINGWQVCHILESSKRNGLRVGGQQWRGEHELPEPQVLVERLRRYGAGVGLAPLWKQETRTTVVVHAPPTLTPPVELKVPEPPEAPVAVRKIEIDRDERDDILDTANQEWQELLLGIKAGTVTPGDFAEAGFDLVLKVATALIPGTLDDMVVQMFASQLKGLKTLLGNSVDTLFGVDTDAAELKDRAQRRLRAAESHKAKAAIKIEAGKRGGLFRRSPEQHLKRAAELEALASADMRAAQKLEAGTVVTPA